jgi:hypothetical protein
MNDMFKPVDNNKASKYKNSDHAGTPEDFKVYVIGVPEEGEAIISRDLTAPLVAVP